MRARIAKSAAPARVACFSKTSRNVCQLLRYMDRHGYDQFVPRADPGEVERRPLLGLTSGYIARTAHEMPTQGSRAPWYLRQNYILDLLSTTFGKVDHPALVFSRRRDRSEHAAPDALPHRGLAR